MNSMKHNVTQKTDNSKGTSINHTPELRITHLNGKQPYFDAACNLLKQDFSVGVVGSSKAPIHSWTKNQNTPATKQEIYKLLGNKKANGICVFTGYDNLEVIDVDLKNDLSGTLYERLQEEFENQLPGLWKQFRRVKTRSGGYHLYYKCEVVEGSQKLAVCHTKVLIETRGRAGLVVAPPTPGYTLENDVKPPVVSVEKRQIILNICRFFDETVTAHNSDEDPFKGLKKPDQIIMAAIYIIVEAKVDIAATYAEWRDLGFAFANEFGEAGRALFHLLSQFHPDYTPKKCDEHYTGCLRADRRASGKRLITIATFWKMYYDAFPGKKLLDDRVINFSAQVYENLPEKLKNILSKIKDNIKKDVALIGMITALSAAYTRWRFYHGSDSDIKEYSPHLLSLVVGNAGSGKSMTRYGYIMTEGITRRAIEMKEQSISAHRAAKVSYERELRDRQKKNLPMEDLKEPPQPPKYCFGMSASDTTQAALVQTLYENPIGGFAYDSEVDTLVQSNARKDFGGYSDILRKAFHHEPLSRQRKGEGESYIVKEPRLAVMLSGTKDQLRKLIPGEENGLFSRLIYYVIPETFLPYQLAVGQRDIIGDECVALQQEILERADPWDDAIWEDGVYLLQFTEHQEEELCREMQDKEDVERKFGGSISASWFRMGLIIKRIAVTLAAFDGFRGSEMPERPWRAAIAMLPVIKAHCIQALQIIRENKGRINFSREEYERLKHTGLTDKEIAHKLDVSLRTLNYRKKEWD